MRRPLFTLLALLLAVSALAQVQGGNIYGTIVDEQGAVLPGCTVTIMGLDRTQTFVTEADGRFRFLGLPPGPYKVSVSLPGFARRPASPSRCTWAAASRRPSR